MEDEDAHPRQPTSARPIAPIEFGLMSTQQRYRLRNPASGREIIVKGEPDRIYLDRDSGETMEVVGKLLPLTPSTSKLPWAVENLRFCSWCNQPAQKDLNDCPTCGRRMGPLSS